MELNKQMSPNAIILTIAVSLIVFIIIFGSIKFGIDYYMGSNQSTDSVVIAEDLQLLTGELYFSAIPDNDFNKLPNVFSLSLSHGKFLQLTGTSAANSISMSYTKDIYTGNQFMLLPGGEIGEHTVYAPFVIYPGSTDLNKSEVNSLPVKSGLFSTDLVLAPDGTRLAFVTHYPESQDVKLEEIPNFRNFSTWTIATVSQREGDVPFYFENAIRPVWAIPNLLVFLKSDGVYVHDFISNTTIPLVLANELGFAVFNTDDSIAVVESGAEQNLVIYKADANELIVMKESATSNPFEVTMVIKNRFSLSPNGREIQQILGLDVDKIATLQVSNNPEIYDQIVIYDISTSELQSLDFFSLEGVAQPRTTMLDSWLTNLNPDI